MSDMFDHEADAWDSYHQEYADEEVTCKFCGKRYLTWAEVKTGVWRLFDDKFRLHDCHRPSNAKVKNMFEDET